MHFFNEISSLAVELSPLIEEKRGFCFLGVPKEQKPFSIPVFFIEKTARIGANALYKSGPGRQIRRFAQRLNKRQRLATTPRDIQTRFFSERLPESGKGRFEVSQSHILSLM